MDPHTGRRDIPEAQVGCRVRVDPLPVAGDEPAGAAGPKWRLAGRKGATEAHRGAAAARLEHAALVAEKAALDREAAAVEVQVWWRRMLAAGAKEEHI